MLKHLLLGKLLICLLYYVLFPAFDRFYAALLLQDIEMVTVHHVNGSKCFVLESLGG
jgi:hypothetical protein